MAEQGLPTGFENSAATWQNMPMIAAMYTGQQNQLAKENQRALQEAFALEQAQKAKMNPLELLAKEASTRLNNSQAGSADALARKYRGDADLADATRPSTISSTNAKNDAEVATSAVTKGDAEAARYGQVANSLANDPRLMGTPAAYRAQWMMKQLGIEDDPERKISAGIAAKIDQMPQMLQDHADYVYNNSAKAKEVAAKEAGDTKRALIQANSMLDAEKMRIEAGKYVKNTPGATKTFEQTIFGLKKASEKRAALLDAAKTLEAENPALAESYRSRAEELTPQAQAEFAAAGGSTVAQVPGQRPTIVPKGSQVDLGGTSKPKLGTKENPIKLD